MVKKWQHYLKENKTSGYPREFIFFDTETFMSPAETKGEYEHTLRLGVACYLQLRDDRTTDTEVWLDFYDLDTFWDFVFSHARPKQRLLLMAHNLDFDAEVTGLFGRMESESFLPKKIILDFGRHIWRFAEDRRTILCLDTLNYFHSSLKTLGESLGITKLDMPEIESNNQTWLTYCRRDVEILKVAMISWLKFLAEHDLGNFGYTLASQAFNAFRHRFMPCPIGVHTNQKATGLERASYRGGWVECHQLGELTNGPYHLLDINSQYPYVMNEYEYPVNLKGTCSNPSLEEVDVLLHTYCLTARCLLQTDEPCYGIKHDNRLIFPVGTFEAYLCTEEIRYALQHDHLLKVFDLAIHAKAPIFSDYVAFFYQARQDFTTSHQEAYAYNCKILLNSLYGKFGQRVDEWEEVGRDETKQYDSWSEIRAEDNSLHSYRIINHIVYHRTGISEGYNSYVAIASEVTANARLLLHKLKTQAGHSNVFYTDTDSLLVNDTGLKRLNRYLHPSSLGKLKLEKTIERAVIRNVKDYELGDRIKHKGVRATAIKISDNVYRQFQSVNIKGALRRGDPNRCLWIETDKRLARQYLKGTVDKKGFTHPFVMTFDGNLNRVKES